MPYVRFKFFAPEGKVLGFEFPPGHGSPRGWWRGVCVCVGAGSGAGAAFMATLCRGLSCLDVIFFLFVHSAVVTQPLCFLKRQSFQT